MTSSVITSCLGDWNDLEKEFTQLQEDHKEYQKKLEQMVSCQKKCVASIAHHRYRIKQINESLKKVESEITSDEKEQLENLKKKIAKRKLEFRDMEEVLPHKNGIYLSIILGSVNISLLNKADKYQYKQDYEKFKLTVSYVVMFLSAFMHFIPEYRWIDAVLNFLLVWYYCTLTIRESILVVNGSRIKGWWVTHHFISTVCAAISLIWPDSLTYQLFRKQYIFFILYLSCVYVMQYYYQSGCLYRMRSLGEGHDMDITAEGFMSWMWKGLAFLLPPIFFGYFFQCYNAYVLYHLSQLPECKEWQVIVLAAIHFVLFAGNLATTLRVIRQKIQSDLSWLRNRYRNSVDNNKTD
ncbi:ion channel TACAN [Patella vulgata]|uniref:ion channel TACAN n=1 Tax=Patella vulgata TaxID=6465 RepID=UPI00217F54FA|nr:ion channel TACAN [Patella vulgata]